MVTKLEIFRQYFEDFSNDYVLIGGVACELILNSMRIAFRLTDDFDIVIISENIQQGFGKRLKELLQDGGYTVQHRKSNNRPTFFRFVNPLNEDFPKKIELATNRPAEDWTYGFKPLDIGDDKSSLSAILFEPDYYDFICSNTSNFGGITTISLARVIPLKALAFQELSKKNNPTRKDLLDIEKHFNDIFQFADVLPGSSFSLSGRIAANLSSAFEDMQKRPLSNEQLELLNQVRSYYRIR